jgi:hypothetical protein
VDAYLVQAGCVELFQVVRIDAYAACVEMYVKILAEILLEQVYEMDHAFDLQQRLTACYANAGRAGFLDFFDQVVVCFDQSLVRPDLVLLPTVSRDSAVPAVLAAHARYEKYGLSAGNATDATSRNRADCSGFALRLLDFSHERDLGAEL